MRKKIFITGALLALVLLLGTSVAFAQNSFSDNKNQPRMHSGAWFDSVAEKLHLSADDIAAIKADLKSGVPITEVLAKYDITMDEIRAALGTAMHADHHRLTNTEIARVAKKLGLDADEVKKEIAEGKSMHQILADHGVTPHRIENAFKGGHVMGKHKGHRNR